jgi:hypothetical protein
MTAESTNVGGYSYRLSREIALWLAIACILAAAIGYSWDPTPFAQALAAIFIGSALLHGAFLYDVRAVLVLFVISVTITFAVENVGAATIPAPGRAPNDAGDRGMCCRGCAMHRDDRCTRPQLRTHADRQRVLGVQAFRREGHA